MILPADKDGVTCVVSREDYVKEDNRQLSDPATYKVLNHDVTNKVKKSVEELLVGIKKDNVVDQNPLFKLASHLTRSGLTLFSAESAQAK